MVDFIDKKQDNDDQAGRLKARDRDIQIVSAFGRAFGSLLSIGSGIFGLAFLAYIIGWTRALAYYSAFGASWLADELSTTKLLSFSIYPINWLILGLILSMADIAKVSIIGKPIRRRVVLLISGVILIAIISGVLSAFNKHDLALVLAQIVSLHTALLCSLAVAYIIDEALATGFKLVTSSLSLLVVIVTGFYLSVYFLGTVEGRQDASPRDSGLKWVVTNREPLKESRLLLSNGKTFYIAELDSESTHPKIRIVDATDIVHISASSMHPIKDIKDKSQTLEE